MQEPVLLSETISFLRPENGDFIIDATVGDGGHAEAILSMIGSKGSLVALDWDEESLARAKDKISQKFEKDELRVQWINGNYAKLADILAERGLPKANGLVLDLGFSSSQLDSGRGFSFLKDEFLDMRYNEQETSITAFEIVNKMPEKDLAAIFYKYGDEKFSGRVSRAIVSRRKIRSIETTFDLVAIVRDSLPRFHSKSKINPATRVFQALRIYVNNELSNLETLLNSLEDILESRGRIVVISFHSLEDRLVKNSFKQLAGNGKAIVLTKKPIRPTQEEVENNYRSRSARLRAAILN